jgi:Tfp pilus assembly protein PilF
MFFLSRLSRLSFLKWIVPDARLCCLVAFFALMAVAFVPARASEVSSLVTQAHEKFTAQDYNAALPLLRRHLRSNSKDYHAWNLLAASYYHVGLPKRALRYLQSVERRTTEASFNNYYQGLCHLALNNTAAAEADFQKAANASDEYGTRSIFELAVLDYKQREKERVRYWLNNYMMRAPHGVYKSEAHRILQSLDAGIWLEDVKGADKPNLEDSMYRYNRLSLSPQPHYWLLQTGYNGELSSSMQPEQNGGLGSREESRYGIILAGSIGLGPVKSGNATVLGGYSYRQLWNTDDDRLAEYIQDFTDITWQPFRADMMERRHQLFADARQTIQDRFFLGVFGRLEFVRIGSKYFPSPDDRDMREVFPVSDSILVIPWAGLAWNEDMRTSVYAYLRREVNTETPEYSNKTYSLSNPSTLSMGLSHAMEFKPAATSVNLELFRYQFLYNNYWADYTRLGAIASAEHFLLPSIAVTGSGGYYSDTYTLPRIKVFDCAAKPKGEGESQTKTSGNPRECDREDSGIMVQAGAAWYYTQFHRVGGSFLFVQNESTMLEMQSVRQIYRLDLTMAFPGIKRVTRFVDRFADNAFTKEAH